MTVTEELSPSSSALWVLGIWTDGWNDNISISGTFEYRRIDANSVFTIVFDCLFIDLATHLAAHVHVSAQGSYPVAS